MTEEKQHPWPMDDWPGEPSDKPEWWDDPYNWYAYQRRKEHLRRVRTAEREQQNPTTEIPWPHRGKEPWWWSQCAPIFRKMYIEEHLRNKGFEVTPLRGDSVPYLELQTTILYPRGLF